MRNALTKFRKTREGWNCRFQKTPRPEGGDKVPAVSTQGSRQVCLPGARNPRICSILRFGIFFPAIFPGFSRSFPREPRTDPGNSDSLLEFSEFKSVCKVKLARMNFSRRKCSQKKCSDIFPKILSLSFVGPKKNSTKFPLNFPLAGAQGEHSFQKILRAQDPSRIATKNYEGNILVIIPCQRVSLTVAAS